MKDRKSLILLLVLLAILISGCGAEPTVTTVSEVETTAALTEPEYVFTHASGMDIEPYGSKLFLKGSERIELSGNIYDFSPDIPEAERITFIELQEQLIAYLSDGMAEPVSGLNFRIQACYPCRSDSDNAKVYFGMDTAGTWEQALATLQAVFGDYTNYGYLYALANQAAEDLGWICDSWLGEADMTAFSKNPALLNLVYPCFLPDSAMRGEIIAAKTLSLELVAEMDNPYSGEADFAAAAQTYAAGQGIEFAPSYLGFAYNGPSCPMKIRTRYLEVCRDSTYEADYYTTFGNPTVKEWTASVDGLISTLENVDKQLAEARAIFGYEDEDLLEGEDLAEVRLLSSELSVEGDAAAGIFCGPGNAMQVQGYGVILHEYVHYLFALHCDRSWDYEGWETEAVAYYLARQEDYETFILIYGVRASVNYEALVGKPLESPDDMPEYFDVIVHLQSQDTYPKYWLNQGGNECISVAGYIVREYGEDAFMQIMLSPRDTKAVTGKAFDELVEDWCEYIIHDVTCATDLTN